MSSGSKTAASVWHEGELQVQERAGVRREAEFLSGMYKSEVPGAMAAFLSQQQFAVLSTRDGDGGAWASLVAGSPGMIQVTAPDSIALIAADIQTELPLSHITADPKVGLIAIDFSRRIRVRVNGEARNLPEGNVQVKIAQLYGNCSQYIQKRCVDGTAPVTAPQLTAGGQLSEAQQDFIRRADTFFLASRHPELGADASHRGGKPGFVTASATRISFPDYPGNNMFNTLGNITVNPAVGLLFVDFESGRTLQVSGRATVDWDRERASHLDLAQRIVDVDVEAVRDTEHATGLHYRFIGYSPTLG